MTLTPFSMGGPTYIQARMQKRKTIFLVTEVQSLTCSLLRIVLLQFENWTKLSPIPYSATCRKLTTLKIDSARILGGFNFYLEQHLTMKLQSTVYYYNLVLRRG